MKHDSAENWPETGCGMRDRVEDMLERMANAVKDTLLDWEMDDEPANAPTELIELPPLEPALFVDALRIKLEEAMWRMADAINDAPPDRMVAGSEEAICALFADLCREALELGLQMRLDAAETSMPLSRRPHGEWARRWRRMHAGDGKLSHARLPNPAAEDIV